MKKGRILAIVLAVTWLMAGAWAQDYPPGPNGEEAPAGSDGPQPDVARISLIHGDVSTQRSDTGDWAATSINAPLVRGDQVATGDKSRAEIQLDYANIVRLAARSQVKIADLARTRIQLQVAQGYASYTMFKGSEADVEIDSPNVSVRPLKPGRYRVQVNSDAETDVIVRDGEAEITTPQGSTVVKEGHVIQVRGTENPEYRIADAPGKDDWDRWNKDRDNTIREASSWGRTNRYYTGVHDLDGYGHWVFVPGYGWVWQPYYTSAGWAPYQAGRWVWEPYYGWTWVSYEPWGWAPYHYGRWFFYSGNWCWWPGPVYVHYRPVWSPAFVFFVGFGHHSTFGFGSIGWFPVGPHDPYYPWWGRGFNRVNVVNVTNITNITNINNVNRGHYFPPLATRGRQPYYSNVHLVETNGHGRHAITTVSTEDFGRGDFRNRRHGVDEHEWREGRVMTAQVPMVPTRDNLRVSSAGGAGVPAGMQPRTNDRFFTRHQPPAGFENFHDQRARVERVVAPESAGAQGGARTDFHAGPGQVERRDQGGVNARTGIAEVPRNDRGGNAENSGRDGFRRFPGNGEQSNTGGRDANTGGSRRSGGPDTVDRNAGPKDSPARMAPGANEGLAQNNPPANSGNSANDNRRDSRDRGGWSRFGKPDGDSGSSGNDRRGEQTSSPANRSTDQGRVPRTDNGNNDSRRGGDGNWQKFPGSGGDRAPQTERSVSPAQNPGRSQEDRGGWQRFPSNNDRGSRDNSAGRDSGGSKPPLELHRPIVTPRNDSRDDSRYSPPRNEQPRYSPPSRSEEPRYSPPSRSESPRYAPPSGGGRSESPRYTPPSRSEHGGGSSSHGGGSSSSHGGSGDRGGHNDSKSSGPKQR